MFKPTISAIIADATYWKCVDDTYIAEINDHDFSTVECYSYTKEEVNHFDQRLSETLCYLFAHPTSYNGFEISENLQLTYAHWQHTGIPYFDEGPVKRYVRAFTAINSASTLAVVHARVLGYEVTILPSGLDVVVEELFFQKTYSAKWMERHYPGSMHRIQAAMALGYTEMQVAEQVCSAEKTCTSMCLPDEIALLG